MICRRLLVLVSAMGLLSYPGFAGGDPSTAGCPRDLVAAYNRRLMRNDRLRPDLPTRGEWSVTTPILPPQLQGVHRLPSFGSGSRKIFEGDLIEYPVVGAGARLALVQEIQEDGDGAIRVSVWEAEPNGRVRVLRAEERDQARRAPTKFAEYEKQLARQYQSLDIPVPLLPFSKALVVSDEVTIHSGDLIHYQFVLKAMPGVAPETVRKVAEVQWMLGDSGDLETTNVVVKELGADGRQAHRLLGVKQLKSIRVFPFSGRGLDADLAIRVTGPDSLFGSDGGPLRPGDTIYYDAGSSGGWTSGHVTSLSIEPELSSRQSTSSVRLDDGTEDDFLSSAHSHYDRVFSDPIAADREREVELRGIRKGLPYCYFRHVFEVHPDVQYGGSRYASVVHRMRPSEAHLERFLHHFPGYAKEWGYENIQDRHLLHPDVDGLNRRASVSIDDNGLRFASYDNHLDTSELDPAPVRAWITSLSEGKVLIGTSGGRHFDDSYRALGYSLLPKSVVGQFVGAAKLLVQLTEAFPELDHVWRVTGLYVQVAIRNACSGFMNDVLKRMPLRIRDRLNHSSRRVILSSLEREVVPSLGGTDVAAHSPYLAAAPLAEELAEFLLLRGAIDTAQRDRILAMGAGIQNGHFRNVSIGEVEDVLTRLGVDGAWIDRDFERIP